MKLVFRVFSVGWGALAILDVFQGKPFTEYGLGIVLMAVYGVWAEVIKS